MIPLVVDLPVKGPPTEAGAEIKNEELSAKRLEATAPKNLIDPTHAWIISMPLCSKAARPVSFTMAIRRLRAT